VGNGNVVAFQMEIGECGMEDGVYCLPFRIFLSFMSFLLYDNQSMAEPTKASDLQSMSADGMALVAGNSSVLLSGLLGSSARKLCTTVVWHGKNIWKITSKIPTYSDLDSAIKQGYPLWKRSLHSQSARAVPEELGQTHKSRDLVKLPGRGERSRIVHSRGERQSVSLTTALKP